MSLKEFTGDEILSVLNACSDYLMLSYQETQYHPFWEASLEAKSVMEYLMSQIELMSPQTKIH